MSIQVPSPSPPPLLPHQFLQKIFSNELCGKRNAFNGFWSEQNNFSYYFSLTLLSAAGDVPCGQFNFCFVLNNTVSDRCYSKVDALGDVYTHGIIP